jgi:arylsulfatase A-like enzyme
MSGGTRDARGARHAFRAAAATLALGAGLLAWRAGGGAEAPAELPRAPDAGALALAVTDAGAGAAARPARPGAPDGYEAFVRLVEIAKDARFEIPSPAVAALAKRDLDWHWRKMRPPWVRLPGGQAAAYVSSVALRTSATETQWAMPAGSGKAWAPDARIWNMNEGSFDQRESIVAPAPSAVTFHVAVPQGARFVFAEGTLNATRDVTVFVVEVKDARGAAKEVYRHRLAPNAARRWTEASCDLSSFAGQSVELRLSVETAIATAAERRPLERPAEPAAPAEKPLVDAGAAVDAGAPDALAIPGTPVALWGNPTVLVRTETRVPYNVLWIVVDAMRPDVLASFHDDADDARKLAGRAPPLEALLPKVPGLAPSIDDLAKRGARFVRAYSGGAWTRPGTLAMLAGARSTELGLDTTAWVVPQPDAARFYASDPPLLPLLLRRQGVTTRAFVNNYFMVGYAPVGVDIGFERVDDHRYRTRDTLEITRDARAWIEQNKDTRFFLFVNYNSPHEPYEPPEEYVRRIPPPPAGPADKIVRLYMAEAAKDDAAIGVLLQTLDDAGLRERTIVVVTADHGETLSSAHTGTSGLDKMPIRYHHAVSNYEETTRVPILVVAPGLLPAGAIVRERVRSVDLAPTLAELLGLEPTAKMSGKSLVALARGGTEADERVVVTEGRGTRGIIAGKWRLLVREGPARTTIKGDKVFTANEELYDLDADPGERFDLAPDRADVVAEMRARLAAALKNVPVAGTSAAVAPASADVGKAPTLHLRFAGGGAGRRVSGTITIGDAHARAKTIDVEPVELGRDALTVSGARVDVAFVASADTVVGLDLVVDPPSTPIAWDLYLDDRRWPDELVFAGPYGLLAPALRRGVTSDEARLAAQSPMLPPIDPRRDVGLFVVRERRGEVDTAPQVPDEGAEEMARLLREWGYAHGSSSASSAK